MQYSNTRRFLPPAVAVTIASINCNYWKDGQAELGWVAGYSTQTKLYSLSIII